MGPLALLPLLLLAQTHSRWEAAVRAEVRARSATPDEVVSAAGDAELRPRLSGAIFNGPWTLSASYSPTFRTRQPYNINDRRGRAFGDHSHTARVEGIWMKEAAARIFAGAFVNYGTLDLSTLNRESAAGSGPAPTPQIQPVRGLGETQELSVDGSAGADWYLTQRTTLTTTAGYLYGGGVDGISQRSLPLQSSIRGAARLARPMSRLDTLAVGLNAQYVRFYPVATYDLVGPNPGGRIGITELGVYYTRLLTEQTRANLALGVTAAFGDISVRTQGPFGTVTYRPRTLREPGALIAAGLSHRAQFQAQRLDFRINTELSPFVDRFEGTVYQRIEAGAGLAWSNAHHVSASISGGVARSLPELRRADPAHPATPTETAQVTVYGESSVGYQGDPWWRVDLQSRLSIQSGQSTSPAPLDPNWVVGVSLTLIAASEQPRVTTPAE